MALGEMRHVSRRVARMALRGAARNRSSGLSAHIIVSRNITAKGRGIFEARACIPARGMRGVARQGVARCGALAVGSSPTKAVKAALRKLAARL